MEGQFNFLTDEQVASHLDSFCSKITKEITRLKTKENNNHTKTRLLNRTQILKVVGVSDSTFDRISHELPLHKNEKGRWVAWEHDLYIYLAQKHPPYYDINRIEEYLDIKNLYKQLG